MPTLKQLTCSLQLGPSATKLKEYGHRYTDGGVEAYVAVPAADVPFHLMLTSSGYVAPGLAAYVFIDGKYQCNRNRQNLSLPRPGMSRHEYEVDFCFRQREEKTDAGTFIAREWSFAQLKASTEAPSGINADLNRNAGTIEVVVLRCKDDPTQRAVAHGRDQLSLPKNTSLQPSATVVTLRRKDLSDALPLLDAAHGIASQPASKSPSAIADGMLGGLSGLFDGAGDEADPLLRYQWHVRPGTARGREVYDIPYRGRQQVRAHASYSQVSPERHFYTRQPFTVHGGRPTPRQSHAPARPDTILDERVPFAASRPTQAPHSPVLPHFGEYQEDVTFVLDMCEQIEQIKRRLHEQKQVVENLLRDIEISRHDPDLHLATMRALRKKQASMQGYCEEVDAIFGAIVSRMRRMDDRTWQYTRHHLVTELRLVPPDWLISRRAQSLDPKEAAAPKSYAGNAEPKPQRCDGWQEVGRGEVGLSLVERKRQQQQEQAQKQINHSAGDDRDGNNKLNKDDDWGSPDEIDKPTRAEKDDEIGRWKNDSQDANEWPNDAANNEMPGVNQQESSWGKNAMENSGQGNNIEWGDQGNGDVNRNDPWPSSKDGSKNGYYAQQHNVRSEQGSKRASKNDWAAEGTAGAKRGVQAAWENDEPSRDARSQSHRSKVKAWDDGGTQPGDMGRAKVSRSSSNQHRAMDRSGQSSNMEPIIKPYWADWSRPSNPSKLDRKARDAYEYSAPPMPKNLVGEAGRAHFSVAVGRGANYAHITSRPEYLDTMQKPYAIFTFKYRSQSELESILHCKIDTSAMRRAVEEAEKERLARLPKQELIKQILKSNTTSVEPESGRTKPHSKGTGRKDDPQQSANRWKAAGRDESIGGYKKAVSQKEQAGWAGEGNKEHSNKDNWATSGNQGDPKGSKNSKGASADGWGDGAQWGNPSARQSGGTREHFEGEKNLNQTSGNEGGGDCRADVVW